MYDISFELYVFKLDIYKKLEKIIFYLNPSMRFKLIV